MFLASLDAGPWASRWFVACERVRVCELDALEQAGGEEEEESKGRGKIEGGDK